MKKPCLLGILLICSLATAIPVRAAVEVPAPLVTEVTLESEETPDSGRNMEEIVSSETVLFQKRRQMPGLRYQSRKFRFKKTGLNFPQILLRIRRTPMIPGRKTPLLLSKMPSRKMTLLLSKTQNLRTTLLLSKTQS